MSERPTVHYIAAGGVVLHHGRVLVLDRPGRNEVRLPKGHVEQGEPLAEAAMREVGEESGYAGQNVLADLGTQVVEFDYKGEHVVRTERYFLMALKDPSREQSDGEAQFIPQWMTWERALETLTFDAEREWVRRAKLVWEAKEK